MLHNNKDVFKQLILRVCNDTGISPAIIEKDYYVTLFLREIVKFEPNIIFKGGTSLSKCFKLINRFSEDIDLTIDTIDKPTDSQRKHLKLSIVSIVNSLKLEINNFKEIHSRRSYNKYIVDYHSAFEDECLKEKLIIETSLFIKSYPCKIMPVSSLIYDYLIKNNMTDFIQQYELQPFMIKVQILERTLIDKIYALGDYYLSNNITEHSRHLYDIHKLLEIVKLDSNLKKLKDEVVEERRKHASCFSAQKEVNIKQILKEIITQDIYKKDYETITKLLLFEDCLYETAITSINKIVESGILD